MDGTVLVADDDRTIRTVLTQALTRAGCKVRSTGNVSTLWRWVEEGEGDAVVSDVMLPDGDGLEMLPAIKKKRPDLPVIIISAQNTVVTAVNAAEAGAYDYLPKPFDLKELLSKVNKALSNSAPPVAQISPAAEPEQKLPLIGSSPAMQEVYRLVARVVNTDLAVMISGESGSGKDILARVLHDLGHRRSEEFVVLQAATLTVENVAEAFGIIQSERDDPISKRATIYLDEISELSSDVQTQLLDCMRSDRFKSMDFRLISSTKKGLEELVNSGDFREDLFYRLNVMPIVLPPLRDRLTDIGALAQHFLDKAAQNGMPRRFLSKKGIEIMRAAMWPGNVRELENFVSRLVVLSNEEEISANLVREALSQSPKTVPENEPLSGEKLSGSVEAHLRRYFDQHGDSLPPPGLYSRILKEIELPLIALALAATRGNQIKTAELLGINRNTLRKKINDLDIQVTRSKKLM